MRLIIITHEQVFPGEADIINLLFGKGMETLHLRKPSCNEDELSSLLRKTDPQYHHRIVLHDHFSLLESFSLKGIHLNKRNPFLPDITVHSVSKSCHSLKEIQQADYFDYLFLSPVFDSISKSGYRRGFTREQLEEASKQKIIRKDIIALGGISSTTIPLARHYGFGGVAVLGALWENFIQDRNVDALVKRFENLKKTIRHGHE